MTQESDVSFSLAQADDAEVNAAANLLTAHVEKTFGPSRQEPFALLARKNGRVVGLAKGTYHWEWLYIAQLWVEDPERSKGLGKRLLAQVEKLALAQNCAGIYLDTFDLKARQFYLREGFTEFGKLPGMPVRGSRYFFYKSLN
jgi:GNAT superfamily N-acetyltransferase